MAIQFRASRRGLIVRKAAASTLAADPALIAARLSAPAPRNQTARRSTGLGVVLFRAGAAPWHDGLAMPARIAARMPSAAVRLFRSPWNLWTTLGMRDADNDTSGGDRR
jgi:hypothetical protein